MPILFKCECGTPGMVPDEQAGQNYTCQTCGHQGVIPSESSDDCVLVFKDGFPNEGTPYDKADFLSKLSERFFTGHDLVFVNGSWLPISVVYDAPPLPEPPPPVGDEIASTFAELPPIPGVYAEYQKRHPKLRKLNVKRLLRVILPAALALLIIAYFLLFKPIRNKLNLRCSYVLVFNPDSKNYVAELAGKKLNLPANSTCLFQDIVPWFYGKKTLKIKESGGAVAYSVKVPLLPHNDWVVSPGKKLKFDTYEDTYQRTLKTESVKTDAIVKELASNSAPTSLHSICHELHDIGIKQHINSLDDEIFSSELYSFGQIGIKRSEKYLAKFKDNNLVREGKPELARGGISFTIENASFVFDVNDRNTHYTLNLPKDSSLPTKKICDDITKFKIKKQNPGTYIATKQSANPKQISVSFDAKGEKMTAVMEFKVGIPVKNET
ncbi:MAG: hypothetical protein IJS15_15185, partial [Victivallales bacterium]|nr:hypothetical protein [Victivallales bacterium]